jgi:hypothetical protein
MNQRHPTKMKGLSDMKLRAALNISKSVPGVWLIDENGKDRYLISVTPTVGAPNKLALQTIAATISECLPAFIEVADEF